MKSFFAAIVLMLFAQQAICKDLTSRLGVGLKNQFGVDLPSIGVHYYPTADVGVTGALGVDTQKDESKFGFLAGLRKIIFKEDNMNFYMGGALGLLNYEIAGENNSGFEMNGHVGGEFFFGGLDSLAFNFETGVAVTSVKSTRFRTMADHPFRAGIIFYF